MNLNDHLNDHLTDRDVTCARESFTRCKDVYTVGTHVFVHVSKCFPPEIAMMERYGYSLLEMKSLAVCICLDFKRND